MTHHRNVLTYHTDILAIHICDELKKRNALLLQAACGLFLTWQNNNPSLVTVAAGPPCEADGGDFSFCLHGGGVPPPPMALGRGHHPALPPECSFYLLWSYY